MMKNWTKYPEVGNLLGIILMTGQGNPEFFRTELLHPIEGVKHFVTDERPRED